jgi:hypothetical protein
MACGVTAPGGAAWPASHVSPLLPWWRVRGDTSDVTVNYLIVYRFVKTDITGEDLEAMAKRALAPA